MKQMVRAAGTPAITYGVDLAGLSRTALKDARSLIARTAAPQAGGKIQISSCTSLMDPLAPWTLLLMPMRCHSPAALWPGGSAGKPGGTSSLLFYVVWGTIYRPICGVLGETLGNETKNSSPLLLRKGQSSQHTICLREPGQVCGHYTVG